MKHTLNDFEGITERIAMIDEWDDEKSILTHLQTTQHHPCV